MAFSRLVDSSARRGRPYGSNSLGIAKLLTQRGEAAFLPAGQEDCRPERTDAHVGLFSVIHFTIGLRSKQLHFIRLETPDSNSMLVKSQS